jgi:hypothetical protein
MDSTGNVDDENSTFLEAHINPQIDEAPPCAIPFSSVVAAAEYNHEPIRAIAAGLQPLV